MSQDETSNDDIECGTNSSFSSDDSGLKNSKKSSTHDDEETKKEANTEQHMQDLKPAARAGLPQNQANTEQVDNSEVHDEAVSMGSSVSEMSPNNDDLVEINEALPSALIGLANSEGSGSDDSGVKNSNNKASTQDLKPAGVAQNQANTEQVDITGCSADSEMNSNNNDELVEVREELRSLKALLIERPTGTQPAPAPAPAPAPVVAQQVTVVEVVVPPPRGLPPGGIWGTYKYVGCLSKVAVLVCFFMYGIGALCMAAFVYYAFPLDGDDAYLFDGIIYDAHGNAIDNLRRNPKNFYPKPYTQTQRL